MQVKNFTDIKSLLFNNKTVRQTIFKNTFWLSIGMGANKILGFLLLIYAARILGATEYGKFSFALAFISLFGIFQDLGLTAIVTREFAKETKVPEEEKKEREEFHSLISLEILLSVIAFFLILFGSFFITPEPDIRKAILILAAYGSMNSMIAFFCSFFQARQKMEYQTSPIIIQAALATVLGIFFLFRFPSVVNLSYAYLFASVAGLILIWILFNIKIFSLKISWRGSVWRKFLLMSWPVALMGLFGVLYNYIDSVMMGYWGMIAETGWYNAAYRIIFVVLIPMGLFSGSFYPVLSKFFRESKEQLQRVWNYQMQVMILLALPLMVGGIVLAPRLIYFFYPFSFSPSILALQILMVMAGLVFIYRPLLDVLIASNQQKSTFWITFSGALINILLNLFLIPKYRLYGASIATVVTYIIIISISVWLMVKLTSIRIPFLKFLSYFGAASLSSALMYFIIIQPKIYNLNVLLSVTIGASVYFLCLFFLKTMAKPIYKSLFIESV